MTETAQPVTDPQVLAAFNDQEQLGKPVTSADVLAAFGQVKPTHLVKGHFGPDTPEWQEKFGPLSDSNFAQQTMIGAGMGASDLALGGRQIYNQVGGADPYSVKDPVTGLTAENKRAIDAPISHTAAGRLGQALAYSPALFIPGANTLGGAAALGAGLGALQPTIPGESRGLNTGIGAVAGGISQPLGAALGRWATSRASEPFMGMNQKAASRMAAESVGSNANQLDQAAIGKRGQELSEIFNRARSPDVMAKLDKSSDVVGALGANLEDSSSQAFYNNKAVMDFMSHVTSPESQASTEQLGSLVTRIRQAKEGQLYSGNGNRELGLAYGGLQKHLEDLIQGSIKDPAQAAEYALARQQYGNLQELRYNPTLLNSTTGKVNAPPLGNYLQRNYGGFSAGSDSNPLFDVGRWGQAAGEAKGAPRFTLENLGGPWAFHYAMNNPVARALGGVASRAVAPLAGEGGLQTSRLAQALALAQKNRAQEPAQKLVRAEQSQ